MAAAVWLGVLTSLSPCPLATNIAAVSFIGKQVSTTRSALYSGIAYTVGRSLTYLLLGAVLVSATRAIPSVSLFLQRYMNMFLGPALVLVGLFLLDIFSFSFGGSLLPQSTQKKLASFGLLGPLLLGAVFALTFCPVSAALFFGSTISLAVKHGSRIVMPSLYGIGTALPVIAFSFIIALGAHTIGEAFNKASVFEKWARKISGIIFISLGLYLSIKHLF
ncbi:MAG: sulfite exporter TauE/SafE family protein [Chitinivibrionales bacterium]|nr:sulfite exporter TauE/SafE family protein [Chitinivibrionales bacterium]